MSTVGPLTFSTISHWREQMQIGYVSPMEIEALLMLDAALSHTENDTVEEDDPEVPVKTRAWPTRKEA